MKWIKNRLRADLLQGRIIQTNSLDTKWENFKLGWIWHKYTDIGKHKQALKKIKSKQKAWVSLKEFESYKQEQTNLQQTVSKSGDSEEDRESGENQISWKVMTYSDELLCKFQECPTDFAGIEPRKIKIKVLNDFVLIQQRKNCSKQRNLTSMKDRYKQLLLIPYT